MPIGGGRTFEQILRDAIARGVTGTTVDEMDAYIADRMHRHRNPGPPFEVTANGRWVQVSEHAVPGIGTLVFHVDIDDHKRVQAALERSEKRFRDYAKSSSDWLWEIDPDFRYVYHGALDQLDGEHMEFFVSPLGKTRWEMAGVDDPDSDPMWRDHVADLRAQRPFRDFRYTIGGADGVPIQHYRVNGLPIFDEEGVFAGYRGTAAIETEYVERERQLHLRQAQLSEAIEQVQVGVALYDENDRLISRNNIARDFGAAAHLVQPGAKFEDLLRDGVEAGVFPDAEGREEEFIAERIAFHRNPVGHFEYRRAGRWMAVREHRFDNGYTMAILTDVTDLKGAEEEARRSQAKFRKLVEGSLQGVCIHRDLVPLFANQAFADIFGFGSPEEIVALPTLEVLLPEGRRETARRRVRERQAGQRGNDTLVQEAVRRNGERFFAETRLGSIDWEGAPAVQVTVIDVTERESMVRLKDEFVSTVSHELRTPLTSISGALGLVSSGMAGHVPPKVRELIDIANNNAERLVRLIGDLLDIQKIEAGEIGGARDRVSIAELLEAAVAANTGFAERGGVALRVVDGAPHAAVEGDMDQLMQVMTNLLSNAIKFSPEGGTVSVESTRLDGSVAVTVTDQGPGVPPEYRDRIFDKFVQAEANDARRRGGTGLGLSICRALVEHHGGALVHLDHAGGARFRFTLPELKPDTARAAE